MSNNKSSIVALRMKMFISISLICLSSIMAKGNIINLNEYRVDNTGEIYISPILNHLIDSLANKNGGTIVIPSGNYLCGPIIMKSNITLHIDAGATIHFSDNFDDYLPMVKSRWEGIRVKTFCSPIYAIDAHNISITGRGHFEGHGKKWWDYWLNISRNNIDDLKWQQVFEEENQELIQNNDYIKKMHNFLRPPMVMFYNCKNITIEGVSFSNPPFWTIVPTFSENITIHNITIENPGESPNTDGINPSSCKNVHISDCHISVGDDCIVLKSGRDKDGREAAVSTENITINNCTMLNGHGGVVIGSEMSGGIKQVCISNCIFEGTDRGIRLKTMRGRGGVVEDIRVNNIIMRDIVLEGIMINMYYNETPFEPISERTPQFKRIHFSNINIIEAKKGIAIYGLVESKVNQLSFSDLYVQTEKGILVDNAYNLIFENIRLETQSKTPFEFSNCNSVLINGLQLYNPLKESTAIQLNDCNNFNISNCFQVQPISTFIEVNENCKNIYLMNNALPGVSVIEENLSSNKIKLLNTTK